MLTTGSFLSLYKNSPDRFIYGRDYFIDMDLSPNMNHNQQIGQFGERLAADFLVRRGYKILDRNVKTSFKELDLIALKDGTLVFVEVKTRTNFNFGGAEAAMTKKKIINLKQAALRYLNIKKNKYKYLRFDFLAVDYNQSSKIAKIKHYIDII
jgi:putative endonuclease